MTHNTPEEKSPAETNQADQSISPKTETLHARMLNTKMNAAEDAPLPAIINFRQGWSVMTALLLGIGVIVGQVLTTDMRLPYLPELFGDEGNRGLWSWLFGLAGLAGAIAFMMLWRGWLHVGKYVSALAIIASGAGVMSYHHDHLPAAAAMPDHPVMVTLIVTESQRYRNSRQQIKAQIAPDDPMHALTANHLARLTVPADITRLYPGYRIKAEVAFQPLLPQLLPAGFDFTTHALRQNIVTAGFVRDVISIEDTSQFLIARWRRVFQEKLYASMNEDLAAPIASALLPGLRSSIPADLREAWRGAGLAHLLAISGLHMMLVCGIILVLVRLVMSCFPIFSSRFSSFRIAAMTALPFCMFYLLFAGVPVSALRAFIMLGLALVAVSMSRRGITLHHVAVAAIIILITDPSSLFGPAFQMSFSAVFALVVAWNIWLKRDKPRPRRWVMRQWRYFAGIAISSLIASLASMPFALYHFGITTSWSILANIIGMPLMGMVIMPMGVMALLLSPLGLEFIPLSVMNIGILILSRVAEAISSWQGARIAVFPPSAYIVLLLAIAMVALGIGNRIWRRLSAAIYMAAFGLWMIDPRPVAGVIVNYGKPILAVMSSDGNLLTNTRKTDGFASQILAKPFGRSEMIYVREYKNPEQDPNQDQDHVVCERHTCYILAANGQVFAMVWAVSDLTIACQKADIVLALVRARYPCRDGSLLIDRDDYRERGGMLAYDANDEANNKVSGVSIRWVNTAE